MNELKIDLEYCYGIKKLKKVIPFTKQHAVAIYAPNGSMKSSLAQTFSDLRKGTPSKDRFFPMRASKRIVTDENDVPLLPDTVFVITPYEKDLAHTEKTSTLLVNNTLKKEHDDINADVEREKQLFLKALKEVSGSKKDLEREIASTFTREDDFYKALRRIRDEMAKQEDAPFSGVPYDRIFDDKVLALLKTDGVQVAIRDYVSKYNELLDKSTYFKRGFNYYNASTIAKNLADHGFFTAKHTVTLNAKEPTIVTTREQLEKIIDDEKAQILSDTELKKRFLQIEKLITKNEDLRGFNEFIAKNADLVPNLEKLDKFKEDLWKSYIKAKIESYNSLLQKYDKVERRNLEIAELARKEMTLWEIAIDTFNKRFDVPFTLEAKNKYEVMMGKDKLLTLKFTFEDGEDKSPVLKDELMVGLSTGERKALYVLNIVFEVEQRKQSKQETLFVIDDLADSFDYKNKYAIIEYLIEMSTTPHFYQIILTHNFDFFRTINSRYIQYSQCLMAVKTKDAILLNQAEGIKNVFVKDWKPKFFDDAKKRIASIPFLRNLIEYTKGDKDANYLKLTSLLHWRDDSEEITQGELADIFKEVFGIDGVVDRNKKIVDVLKEEVGSCLTAADGINFENKIVLSIAIRLEAEKFMLGRIDDAAWAAGLHGEQKQTTNLFNKYKEKFPPPNKEVETIERVILMTPESIHLNSFMYEPILDMSDSHLKKLFKEVRDLK